MQLDSTPTLQHPWSRFRLNPINPNQNVHSRMQEQQPRPHGTTKHSTPFHLMPPSSSVSSLVPNPKQPTSLSPAAQNYSHSMHAASQQPRCKSLQVMEGSKKHEIKSCIFLHCLQLTSTQLLNHSGTCFAMLLDCCAVEVSWATMIGKHFGDEE